MARAEVLQGLRQMRFEGLLERQEPGELSQGEAVEMLGVRGGCSGAGATGCAMRGRRASAIDWRTAVLEPRVLRTVDLHQSRRWRG